MRHVIPHEVTYPGGRSEGRFSLGGTGRKRPRTPAAAPDWQLRLSTLRRTAGCRPSAARALPISSWPPSRPPTAAMRRRPSSRRSSLKPTKITVKNALAYGLRVARDGATRHSGLRAWSAHDSACRKDGRDWLCPPATSALSRSRVRRLVFGRRLFSVLTGHRPRSRTTPIMQHWPDPARAQYRKMLVAPAELLASVVDIATVWGAFLQLGVRQPRSTPTLATPTATAAMPSGGMAAIAAASPRPAPTSVNPHTVVVLTRVLLAFAVVF